MKPVAELIAVPGKSFPALVFADGFRDLPAGTKLYAEPVSLWISVTDRLPEEGTLVLSVDDHGNVGISYQIYNEQGIPYWRDLYADPEDEPIYWQSLPKPPKK